MTPNMKLTAHAVVISIAADQYHWRPLSEGLGSLAVEDAPGKTISAKVAVKIVWSGSILAAIARMH